MLNGKPAGMRCVQLADDNRCKLFDKPERPTVCLHLKPLREMCGETTDDAMRYLTELERATKPENILIRESRESC